jgi:hypothetical protein
VVFLPCLELDWPAPVPAPAPAPEPTLLGRSTIFRAHVARVSGLCGHAHLRPGRYACLRNIVMLGFSDRCPRREAACPRTGPEDLVLSPTVQCSAAVQYSTAQHNTVLRRDDDPPFHCPYCTVLVSKCLTRMSRISERPLPTTCRLCTSPAPRAFHSQVPVFTLSESPSRA